MKTVFFLLCFSIFATCLSLAGSKQTIVEQIFVNPHLDNVKSKGTLVYSFQGYDHRGDWFEDRIKMMIQGIDADGSKSVEFEIFSGEQKRLFPKLIKRTQNPIFLFFLQRDAEQMSALFGKQIQLFRGMIKRAFKREPETKTLEVTHGKQNFQCEQAMIKPYVNEQRAMLKDFVGKQYFFTLCPKIPGKLYQIKTVVQNEEGKEIFVENLMFNRFAKVGD